MRAMILAAGRGSRMRPLTDRQPKPLLGAGGKPLIVHHIERLREAGYVDLVINLGWLGEMIENALGDGTRFGVRIKYSREPPGALETAGGIVHALPLLGDQPFVVVNSDIFCDFPLGTLYGCEPPGQAHLVLVGNPAHHPAGDFALTRGRVVNDGEQRLTYAGIGVFRPGLFSGLAPGVRPLRPLLERAIDRGEVTGTHHRGDWLDVGTPQRLAELRRKLARQSGV